MVSRRKFGLSLAAGLGAGLRPAGLRAALPRPKLFILLVSNQFRSDYLDAAQRFLSPGGFRRLMSEGAYFPDCRCNASTFTSSALATLATGSWPGLHGVVADTWYERSGRSVVSAGGDALMGTTIAAQMAAAAGTRVFTCSMGQANGELLEGQAGGGFFYMNETGQFSSRGEQQPSWLIEYNRLHAIENVRNAKWVALGAGAGVPPLRTLTYDAAHPEQFLALYRSSPFALAAQFELARELIARERLGQTATQDFLAISLGPPALLGYEVGALSPLMRQMVLHLDRDIEFTLDTLNKAPGAGNYALVFAGAHGAPAAPDPARRAQAAVPGEAVARFIDRALAERFDTLQSRNTYVEKYVYPFLYLRPEALRRNPREVRAAAAQAALNHPAVAGYYTADGDCSHSGDWERRFRNSFYVRRSGDAMLSYRPGCVEDYGAGRGVSYGSLYNYDACAPLFLYGPQFRAREFEHSVQAVDVAPTLARAAGVALPSSSTGRVLGEAFADQAGARK